MRFLILFAVVTLAHAAEVAVVKDAAQTGLDPARLQRIPARLQQFVEQGQAAGFVTLISRHGKIASLEATGHFDRETKAPMRTDHIFQLHSMTKPVVCMAVMMLAEQGLLRLTDPVEMHLPEFRGQQWVLEAQSPFAQSLTRVARPVTIRDLMTHTSGMALNPPAAIGELHGALHKTLAETSLVIAQQPLLFQPGSKWSYSNTGIAALARVIEVLGGMPYERFLEERIFKPLGMTDTHTFPPKGKWHRMPTAYLLQNGKPVKYTMDPLGEGNMKFREGALYPLPEGGLYSTASDLARLYQLMLNRGALNGTRLLSPASVEAMTHIHTGTLATNAPGMGWGLGWFVVRDPAATLQMMSPGTYGHGGRYGTYAFIDPQRDLFGIFLIHREGGSAERLAFVEMTYAALID
jgi:CubicO group peptidase (beta-lactamase class C family)